MAVRRLPGDWQAHHGLRPVLVETFVDPGRFDATCYRAANWRNIGLTKGRKGSARAGGKTGKAVYVYPLARNFRSIPAQWAARRQAAQDAAAALCPRGSFRPAVA